MKIVKSFVIDADVVKTYTAAREFFLTLGYNEQNAIRPTLLVLKKRGSLGASDSQKTTNYRVTLRISFNPVGNMQLYSASLVTIRCEYEIKTSEETIPPNTRGTFENEIEKLRCHLIKGSIFETEAEKSRCNLIESNKNKPHTLSSITPNLTSSNEI